MKKSFFVINLLLLLLFVKAISAAPAIYTFEGIITNLGGQAGMAADGGYQIGETISYQFYADTEQSGVGQKNTGETVYFEDIDDQSEKNPYFAALISEQHISNLGNYNFPTSGDFYTGMNVGIYGNVSGQSFFLNILDYGCDLRINFGRSVYATDLNIGDLFLGKEKATDYYNQYNEQYLTSEIYSNLILTSIDPIPIPSSIFLFKLGLLGLVGVNRRKKMAKI